MQDGIDNFFVGESAAFDESLEDVELGVVVQRRRLQDVGHRQRALVGFDTLGVSRHFAVQSGLGFDVGTGWLIFIISHHLDQFFLFYTFSYFLLFIFFTTNKNSLSLLGKKLLQKTRTRRHRA